MMISTNPIFDTLDLAKQWRPSEQEALDHHGEKRCYCRINEGADAGKVMVVWESDLEKLRAQ